MSNGLPKICIVTPSFNQAAFIAEALESVKAQHYPATEHIVIDGGSTDGTVDILRRYSSEPGWDHLRWVSERDRGQSDALNKGFRMATGDIVGWLNSDDRYRLSCFRSVVKGFEINPGTDILYGDYTWIDEQGQITQIRREIAFSYFILKYHHTLYIPSTATFYRSKIFDDGNFIDENLHFSMDYEFFLRLARTGYHFKHISKLLADFRWHSRSKTVASVESQFREFDQIVRQNSPLLRRFSGSVTQEIALRWLRFLAASLRYSEKLVRGCYVGQLWPSVFKRAAP
jgi:glycosyltransferase involved in cell wall biosynthesis